MGDVPYILIFAEQAQRKQLLHYSLLLITSPLAVPYKERHIIVSYEDSHRYFILFKRDAKVVVPYIVKFTEQAQRKQHRIII